MHLHHNAPHTPPVEDGFAREDFSNPIGLEVIDGHIARDTGSVALQNFVLYGQNPPLRSPHASHDLRVVEPAKDDHLVIY